MQYKPGSKYKVLIAQENEFVTKRGRDKFVGSYLEMSDGTFFEGNNINNLGTELVRVKDQNTYKSKIKGGYKFNILKESYFEFISKTKDIVSTKNFPTKKDYDKGFYERYFAKRKNSLLDYKEIDKKTYNSLKNRKTEYDWHLYDCGKLLWILNGEANNANTKSIKIAERKFKGVGIIFQNTEEFYIPRSITNSKKTQTQAIAESKEPRVFNKTRESHPASDKEVKIPALKDVQEEMLRDIQNKHRKKQDQINQQIQQIEEPETRLEKLNLKTTTGGGMSSGGGSSGGGGGGY